LSPHNALLAARDPNVEPALLLEAANHCPVEVLQNPALSLLALEAPLVYRQIVTVAKLAQSMRLPTPPDFPGEEKPTEAQVRAMRYKGECARDNARDLDNGYGGRVEALESLFGAIVLIDYWLLQYGPEPDIHEIRGEIWSDVRALLADKIDKSSLREAVIQGLNIPTREDLEWELFLANEGKEEDGC